MLSEQKAYFSALHAVEELAKFNIGFAYGLSLIAGRGTQIYYNYGCFWAGVELARLMAARIPGWREASLGECVKMLLEQIGAADEVQVVDEGGSLRVILRGCHFCPKRVGGYELEGTACFLPGLVAGVVSQKLGLEPRLGLVKDMMRRLD